MGAGNEDALAGQRQSIGGGIWVIGGHFLRLLRNRGVGFVNLGEDALRAFFEQGAADALSQLIGISSASLLAQDLLAIRMRHYRVQAQLRAHHFRIGANGNLTASAKGVEGRAFTSRGGAGGGIVED